MNSRTIRGKIAVVGVGESAYYRYGQSPDSEYKLALTAILAAAKDAGIPAKSIDGFASFANDRNTALRVANSLGVDEMRWSSMQWGGGGGGPSGAVAQAAAAIACGFAETVVVYRGLAQGQFGRIGAGRGGGAPRESLRSAYGVRTPAEFFASRANRYFHDHDIDLEAQKAVALASYHHAQSNPRAVMHGRPLTSQKYDESRWIAEPWHLYDCCQESDGACALILVSADRAKDICDRPAYVLGAAMGGGRRSGGIVEGVYDPEVFATAEFGPLAPRLYDMAGLSPRDVDVVQSYENFTGGVVMAMIEHGLCAPEEANDFFTFDNLIAPHGGMPLNTSGGNLAEAYIHGLGLHVEAVRQLRGSSTNQVPDAKVSLVISGPMVTPASNVIFGSHEVL
jgi:acetyl-CoA acetyltransferase